MLPDLDQLVLNMMEEKLLMRHYFMCISSELHQYLVHLFRILTVTNRRDGWIQSLIYSN
jgi:hypothetical protein